MINNDGKLAESWFESHWAVKGKNAFLYRFLDHYEVNFSQGKRMNQRRVAPQPSDYLLTEDGHTCYCEVKSTFEANRFRFSDVQPSQWRAARKQVAAGGDYWFYLLNMNTLKWYRVPARILVESKDQGAKSIPWASIEEFEWVPLVDMPTK
ncbi:hypothetical protein [Photobacterium sp. GSS17]|uniref:hypothetical protein n=1 Tax=Photobacterium sp. GSS17 TaxID=3020715 RepID=UPI00235E3DC6|nr:hypothetical protein [Photobacterium sp. GSS17]